jgi:hypothetical protein
MRWRAIMPAGSSCVAPMGTMASGTSRELAAISAGATAAVVIHTVDCCPTIVRVDAGQCGGGASRNNGDGGDRHPVDQG